VSEKAAIVREIYDYRSSYSSQTSINSTLSTFIEYFIIEEDHYRIEEEPEDLVERYRWNL
jgi:hypothetical protein